MATELQVMCITLQSENVSAIIPSIQAEQLSRDSSDETPLQEKVGQESCSHNWSSKVSDECDKSAKSWNELSDCLRKLLPNEVGITYVVTDFSILPEEAFSGAPEYAYDSTIRVNISNVDRAKEWLQSLMKHSKWTYRHSKGRKPGLKRVLYKVEMHCQHKRKPLTPLQLQQKANARVKSSRKVLMHDLRQKKTECPSCLKFTVVISTKKDQHRALDHPYLLSHPTVLHVTYTLWSQLMHFLFAQMILKLKKRSLNCLKKATMLHLRIIGMKRSYS